MTSIELTQPEDAHTREEWEGAAAGVLRKSGRLAESDPDSVVWAKLTRTTLDGIGVTPLGVPGDATAAVRPARAGAWDIRSLIADPDAKRANEAALVDLDGGVTSLWLAADADTDLAATLDKVLLDLAPVVLDAPGAPLAVAQAFLAYADERGVDPHPGTNLGFDPMGAALRGLGERRDHSAECVEIATLARKAGVLALVADATAAHDLGASDAQELGYGIYAATAYLRALVGGGLSVEDAAALIEFRFAATDEQFPTIAKLRAARQLWARVLELSGVAGGGVEARIHATTSRPMLSKYDPYVNMLRGTVAAFAAGVGGADAVTVLPFDSANGRPEAFGRRIARNVNHLLIDESHVAAVADPAGGAYAVEQLTRDLAAAGWAQFQLLEAEGLGAFGERVEQVVAQRETEIAKRKRPITGVSEFPNLAEVLPEREADPLNDRVRRYGASYEELRDLPATEHLFLATMGTIAQHTARATFASNLFAAGGIAVDVAGATAGPEDLVAAYRGQKVVCLAGTDGAYAEWGQVAAEALRAGGATHVIVAGKGTEYSDDNCAMGIDALAFLNRTRAAIK